MITKGLRALYVNARCAVRKVPIKTGLALYSNKVKARVHAIWFDGFTNASRRKRWHPLEFFVTVKKLFALVFDQSGLNVWMVLDRLRHHVMPGRSRYDGVSGMENGACKNKRVCCNGHG